MQDIMPETLVDSSDVPEIARMIHAAGFPNLALFLERIESERKEFESNMPEIEREANEEGYNSGYEDGRVNDFRSTGFARWYLATVEGKQIVSRMIRGKVFWIITDEDYCALKDMFHRELD